MKLLANENFPYSSIYYLRNIGHDVLSIGIENPSIKDSEIMETAISENRVILTFDRDYGELIFRHGFKPAQGVVYLRLHEYTPLEPGIIVKNLIESELGLSNALTVIDRHGIRQRKY